MKDRGRSVPDGHVVRAIKEFFHNFRSITMAVLRQALRLCLWCATAGFTVEAFVQTRSWKRLGRTQTLHRQSVVSDETTASSDCQSITLAPSSQETIVVPRHYHGDDSQDQYPSLLHNIHIRSVLNDTEASTCVQLAEDYASATGCWQRPDYDRHASYATCDFAVDQCDTVSAFLNDINFSERLLGQLSALYQVPVQGLDFLDLFCAHYKAKGDDQVDVMDRLESHRDGSLLSFVILLNSAEDFDGGGTYFDALRDVEHSSSRLQDGVIRLERPGDATIHSGKLFHGADVVTRGERTVLVGFVEVDDMLLRHGSLFNACRDFGRMDVAIKRYERQRKRTKDGSKGWFTNNERWLPKRDDPSGCSILHGFCPAFSSVEHRADSEFQRRTRLEAEDILLRSILLGESERETYQVFGGDVTVL